MNSERQFVISDIHGCFTTFTNLLDQIHFNLERDVLFLLGDYVSKGTRSIELLDFLIEIKDSPNVFQLLGNHDFYLLNALRSNDFPNSLKDFEGLNPRKKSAYSKFLESLPLYFSLENYLLVHAGFDFDAVNPFQNKESMLNIRDFRYDASQAGNKKIVHGHNPKKLSEIEKAIYTNDRIIPLDNGCVYAGLRPEMGKLLCLELNTKQLYWKENCD